MQDTQPQDRTATVASLLRERSRRTPERPFIRMVGADVPANSNTYGQADLAARRVAAGLAELGVARGEAVVIMLRNSLEAIHAWLGVNLLGAVEVSINTGYRGEPLAHAINQARAGVIVIHAEFLTLLRACADQLPHLHTVVVVGMGNIANVPDPAAASGSWRMVDYAGIAALDVASIDVASTDVAKDDGAGAAVWPSDIASIIYTSGTTGPAKGVMMPHAQVVLLARETVRKCRYAPDDVYYCFHPMYHMAGKFMGVLATLVAGCRIVLDAGFAPDQWLARIREFGVTVSGAHGPMLEMIFAAPASADDRNHRLRTICSAPFPRHIARAFEQRFGVRGVEVWGMTEVGIPIWNPVDEPLREGSCGKVDTANFEFAVVDPLTDAPLPSGHTGEFVVRPRHPWTLMQGYMGMPDKTVEAWRNLWFHSGDAGYMDDEGYVYFVDRASDRIRRRAENISSWDIEVAALAYRGVREAAAVGIPSGYAGDDDIKLCVVAHDGMAVDAHALLAHLAATLPHYMVPRYLEFLAELPRSATNKVRRAALKQAPYGASVWDRKAHGVALRELAAR